MAAILLNMTVKRIVFAIALLAVAGFCIAYYFYNKGPVNVQDAAGIQITAPVLYNLFSNDSATEKKYAGIILEVSGEVSKSSLNSKRQQIILLKAAEGGFINCTMEEGDTRVSINSSIIIKGICSGMGQGDADLGIKGDVYLARCIRVK